MYVVVVVVVITITTAAAALIVGVVLHKSNWRFLPETIVTIFVLLPTFLSI